MHEFVRQRPRQLFVRPHELCRIAVDTSLDTLPTTRVAAVQHNSILLLLQGNGGHGQDVALDQCATTTTDRELQRIRVQEPLQGVFLGCTEGGRVRDHPSSSVIVIGSSSSRCS